MDESVANVRISSAARVMPGVKIIVSSIAIKESVVARNIFVEFGDAMNFAQTQPKRTGKTRKIS